MRQFGFESSRFQRSFPIFFRFFWQGSHNQKIKGKEDPNHTNRRGSPPSFFAVDVNIFAYLRHMGRAPFLMEAEKVNLFFESVLWAEDPAPTQLGVFLGDCSGGLPGSRPGRCGHWGGRSLEPHRKPLGPHHHLALRPSAHGGHKTGSKRRTLGDVEWRNLQNGLRSPCRLKLKRGSIGEPTIFRGLLLCKHPSV